MRPVGKHRAARTPVSRRAVATVREGRAALPAGSVLGGAALGALGAASGVLAPGSALAAAQPGPLAAPHRDAAVVRVPAGARYAAPSEAELEALRGCESTGQYSIATGNGFFGAYQFDLGTWRGLGLDGYPQTAPADLQDAAAAALEQSRGWQPWPACSARLGLVPRPATVVPTYVTVDQRAARTPARTPASAPAGRHRRPLGAGPTAVGQAAAPAHTSIVPAFSGRVLSRASVRTYRADVRLWQERMAQRGWNVAPDGHFGPRSQAVAGAFAAEKRLTEGLPGEVGAQVWAAAWTSPVTSAAVAA